MPGAGRGQKPPTNRETEASGDSSRDKEMTSGLGTAALPIPQRGTVENSGREMRPHSHLDSANGARPERTSKYVLLEPTEPVEPAGDPAAMEIQEHGDGHETTMRTGDQDARETETGDWTRQRMLLA